MNVLYVFGLRSCLYECFACLLPNVVYTNVLHVFLLTKLSPPTAQNVVGSGSQPGAHSSGESDTEDESVNGRLVEEDEEEDEEDGGLMIKPRSVTEVVIPVPTTIPAKATPDATTPE